MGPSFVHQLQLARTEIDNSDAKVILMAVTDLWRDVLRIDQTSLVVDQA